MPPGFACQVTLIPGDGIGPEVTQAVVDVVDAIKVSQGVMQVAGNLATS
jgi:isocitrate/isopropylmalate dehydrogenase